MSDEDEDLSQSWAILRPSTVEPEPVRVPAYSGPIPTPAEVVAQATLPPFVPTGVLASAPRPHFYRIMSRLYDLLGFFVVAFIAIWVGIVLIGIIRSDGRVVSCYIEEDTANTPHTYHVKGQVNWRPNPTMATFGTIDDALTGKKKLCP